VASVAISNARRVPNLLDDDELASLDLPGQEDLTALSDRATEPAREVVKRRFGFNGDPRPQSHATIARHLGRTPSEIRSIERPALTDLSRLRELQALHGST
jgi:DNA-directed RNA polymerase sigma subunit (sigma70/sigma32)